MNNDYLVLFVDVSHDDASTTTINCCVMDIASSIKVVGTNHLRGCGEEALALLTNMYYRYRPNRIVLDVSDQFMYMFKRYRNKFERGTEILRVHRV